MPAASWVTFPETALHQMVDLLTLLARPAISVGKQDSKHLPVLFTIWSNTVTASLVIAQQRLRMVILREVMPSLALLSLLSLQYPKLSQDTILRWAR